MEEELQSCPNCCKTLSPTANLCPHCGRLITFRGHLWGCFIFIAALFLSVGALIFGLWGSCSLVVGIVFASDMIWGGRENGFPFNSWPHALVLILIGLGGCALAYYLSRLLLNLMRKP